MKKYCIKHLFEYAILPLFSRRIIEFHEAGKLSHKISLIYTYQSVAKKMIA